MGCCCGLSIWLTARRGGRAIAECMVEQQPHGVSQQCHQNALCSTCKILLTVISKVWLNHSFSSIKAGGHGCQCFDKDAGTLSHDDEKQEKGRNKLLQAWQGDIRVPGEGADPYIQRVFRHLDTQTLNIIIREAERFLLPIARNNLA